MRNVADKIVERLKTHILCSGTFFFRKSCPLGDNAEKYRGATDDNTAHAHYMPDT